MPDFSTNISNLKLERYLLRELPAAEMRAMETLLNSDAVLRERLRILQESNAAILRDLPPNIFAQRLHNLERRRKAEASVTGPERGLEGSTPRSFGVWKPVLGSLALVLPLLAILVLPNRIAQQRSSGEVLSESPVGVNPAGGTEGVGQGAPTDPHSQPSTPSLSSPEVAGEETPTMASEEGIRLKGLEPHLAIFRKTDSGAEPLHPGEKARPGQFLRIGYQAGGYPYGAILSVDGNGNVTRHWPAEGNRAGRLENGEALLPSSFELDGAPDYERFYFVVSKKPFELNPLLQSLHENESLPDLGKFKAAKDTRIVRFEILKENGI